MSTSKKATDFLYLEKTIIFDATTFFKNQPSAHINYWIFSLYIFLLKFQVYFSSLGRGYSGGWVHDRIRIID